MCHFSDHDGLLFRVLVELSNEPKKIDNFVTQRFFSKQSMKMFELKVSKINREPQYDSYNWTSQTNAGNMFVFL